MEYKLKWNGYGIYVQLLCILVAMVNNVDAAQIVYAKPNPHNLSCFECKDNFRELDPGTYSPNTPCQQKARFNEIGISSCSVHDRYCKVERVELNGKVLSIERGCTEKCFYGCRFNGYGLTYMKCTSCCMGYACNTDNSSRTVWSNTFQWTILSALIARWFMILQLRIE
ncbi:unnamed protein product [Owenia fusiformis]|uniref:Uncharacterized protein n=1 Tax=Owenia fusiformis TaxID=6347 RepID=A0A8J1UN57_OWEFU|nr:unnamed protein product [Owenia fusiformis]